MAKWGIAVGLGAAVALAGCGGADKPQAGPARDLPVEITPVNFAGLDAALKEQRGRVVVVDFWATF